jgi:hypothetical protein
MLFSTMDIATTRRGLEVVVGDQVHGKVWNEDLLAQILVKVCTMLREGSRGCERFELLSERSRLGLFFSQGVQLHSLPAGAHDTVFF